MDNSNNTSFVSTTLSPESGLPQTNPMVLEIQADPAPAADPMDSEYPEIYYELYPLVVDAVDKLTAAGAAPSPDMIDSLVDAIIQNSGMWYEDDDDNNMIEAVPAQFSFGGSPYRRRRRRHHNRNTLRDIVRILLLRELFDKRGRRSYPGYY